MAVKLKKLPTVFNLKLGELRVEKGLNEDGEKTYSWDVGMRCSHSDCPAIAECTYEEHILEDGNCKVLRSYLRSVALVLYQNQKDLDAAQRFQVGMHIMPLYRTLCRMKLEEVGVQRVVTETPRGTLQVHPIYKEIRETIKAIDQIWRSIGVRANEKPDEKPAFGSGGTGNYYDAMEKRALAET